MLRNEEEIRAKLEEFKEKRRPWAELDDFEYALREKIRLLEWVLGKDEEAGLL